MACGCSLKVTLYELYQPESEIEKMIKLYISLLFITCSYSLVAQQKTYAFFMFGTLQDKNWERLEFTIDKEKNTINYSYAKNEKGIELVLIDSPNTTSNPNCIFVKIPKLDKVYMISINEQLDAIVFEALDKSYKKTFILGYEGPIDGIGTYCESCANEAEDAFEIVRLFMQKNKK